MKIGRLLAYLFKNKEVPRGEDCLDHVSRYETPQLGTIVTTTKHATIQFSSSSLFSLVLSSPSSGSRQATEARRTTPFRQAEKPISHRCFDFGSGLIEFIAQNRNTE
jgi:hypothetical protein